MSFSNIDFNDEYYAYHAPHINEDYDESLQNIQINKNQSLIDKTTKSHVN